MGAHLIFFIIFTLFSCIILINQSLPWYSLRSGFQCDTKMAAVFSCMRPVTLGGVVWILIYYKEVLALEPAAWLWGPSWINKKVFVHSVNFQLLWNRMEQKHSIYHIEAYLY